MLRSMEAIVLLEAKERQKKAEQEAKELRKQEKKEKSGANTLI